MSHPSLRVALPVAFIAACLAMAPSQVTAQSVTYTACRVPDVGAIYMIRLPPDDLPDACLETSHVLFTWTEGASPQDGSITEAKLAFDPATQSELDGVTAGLSAAGTINDVANPVDWSRLKGVPAGFADGVDQDGGTAGDLACAGCVDQSDIALDAVGSAQLADAAVTLPKLTPAGRVALTQADIASRMQIFEDIYGSFTAGVTPFSPRTLVNISGQSGFLLGGAVVGNTPYFPGTSDRYQVRITVDGSNIEWPANPEVALTVDHVGTGQSAAIVLPVIRFESSLVIQYDYRADEGSLNRRLTGYAMVKLD